MAVILLLALFGCYEDEEDTKSKVCDKYGCVTCKTYSNWDNTKFETKCTGTGAYAAIYADDVNNDPNGVVVEETTEGL